MSITTEAPEPPGRVRTRTKIVTVLDVEMTDEEALAFLDVLEHYQRCDGHDPSPVLALDQLRYSLRETLGL